MRASLFRQYETVTMGDKIGCVQSRLDERVEVFVDTRAVLDRELDRAFGLAPGPAKEREINRLVVDLIAGLVREASPDAREIWFDWNQDGLCITAIRDGRGDPCIEHDEVGEHLSVYASNIRDTRYAPQLAAVRGIHGPFILQV